MLGILFDIGGTKTRIALTRDGRRFGRPVIFQTVGQYARGVRVFEERVRALSGGRRVTAFAGGIAGPLNREKTMLVNSPNIGGWIRKPFVARLRRTFHAPVTLENDAAVVGLGEAVAGAGRGYPIVAYITVSTGVGGARIVNGVVDVTAYGFEPGHQLIHDRRSLQDYVSGRSLERRTHRSPKDVSSPAIWRGLADRLAQGLANVSVFWSPDVIVLGGSMFKSRGISIPLTRRYLRKYLMIFPRPPRVVRGTLGDIGGLYGALQLLRTSLNQGRR